VQSQPKIDALLPLVALGTVADVVKLDANNRRLVAQGLKRVRAGAMPPGMAALFNVAGRQPEGHQLRLRLCPGPAPERRRPPGRHDAGHRMPADRRRRRADELARTLDGINRERKPSRATCASRP
jgi:single-stranded-DNA-specific exonuclease